MRSLMMFLILTSFDTSAQFNTEDQWTVEGNIINIFSKNPVKADISYETLPFGGNIGVYHGDKFDFSVPEATPFRLNINAEGYTPFEDEIAADQFNNGIYFTTIELIPNNTHQLIRLEKLLFNLGKADISDESYPELDAVVFMLKENPNMVIQLEGHTDFRGNAKQNMRLSKERVQSVRAYLVEQGIKKKRIKTKAFGGIQPINRQNEPKARELNRRVEVRILSND